MLRCDTGFARMQPRKVMRQEIVRRFVGRCGQPGKYPPEIGFRIDAQHAACADHAIDDRRAPTGGRMADEQIIPKSNFRGSKAPLDGVLIDVDMTNTHLGVACQQGPSVRGVGHRFSQIADDSGVGGEHPELSVQAFQGKAWPCRGSSSLVACATVPRQALEASDVGSMLEDTGVHFRPVCLDLSAPFFRKKIVQDRSAARRRELDDECFLVRGQIAPQIGIMRSTSAIGVHEFGEGFIGLNVAAGENLLLQLLADADQQMRGSIDVTAARLAGNPSTTSSIDTFLPIQRDVVNVLCRSADYAA